MQAWGSLVRPGGLGKLTSQGWSRVARYRTLSLASLAASDKRSSRPFHRLFAWETEQQKQGKQSFSHQE